MNFSSDFLVRLSAAVVISPFLIWFLEQPGHSLLISLPLCALNGWFVSKGIFE